MNNAAPDPKIGAAAFVEARFLAAKWDAASAPRGRVRQLHSAGTDFCMAARPERYPAIVDEQVASGMAVTSL